MKQGYVHPYHTKINPLVMGSREYYSFLNDLVGPEQVSPHYESVSRSRRGVLFFLLYISTIQGLTQYTGFVNSDWGNEMIFH